VLTAFSPRLDILSPPQGRLWNELAPLPSDFVLYGGTAVALHLGHRASIDFDFFALTSFDPDRLYRSLPFLTGAEVLQKAACTLTCLVDRQGEIRVSFFGVPGLGRVREPVVCSDNELPIASLIDLAGMKAAVVQKRAEAKDYLDLDAMLSHGISLPAALAAAHHIYGYPFNPQITLKALTYFADGDLASLPAAVRQRLMGAVKSVRLDRLPDLQELWRIPPSVSLD
jgi:Nucleotidyl transferase AbiEii toxin, Type IV TA system